VARQLARPKRIHWDDQHHVHGLNRWEGAAETPSPLPRQSGREDGSGTATLSNSLDKWTEDGSALFRRVACDPPLSGSSNSAVGPPPIPQLDPLQFRSS
jgi:hypothetical protein